MSVPGLDQVAAALREMTGLKLDPIIGPDVAAAAERASQRLGLDSLTTLAQRLRADHRLDDEFIAELTVGETYFFRDLPHFEFVRDFVLPARHAAGRTGTFRVWSAGCSTGEEAWSLAMLCLHLQLPSFDVLATDLSVRALAAAAAGSYPAWSVDRCPSPLLSGWVLPQDGRHQVSQALMGSVRFEYLNLASDTYPRVATGTSGLDLIFCRNVLIYLDPKSVALVYQKFFDALAVGGCLVCGPSDPVPPAQLSFKRVDSGMGFAYLRDAPDGRVVSPALFAPVSAPLRALPRTSLPRVEPSPPPVEDDSPQVASRTATGLANQGLHAQALDEVVRALVNHPQSVELRFLAASLLLGAGQLPNAVEEFKRVLYLDPSLAMAHFTLGLALHRLGKPEDAARAYRNAERLAAARPPEELVPLSDGQAAGRLAHSARGQLKLLSGGLDD